MNFKVFNMFRRSCGFMDQIGELGYSHCLPKIRLHLKLENRIFVDDAALRVSFHAWSSWRQPYITSKSSSSYIQYDKIHYLKTHLGSPAAPSTYFRLEPRGFHFRLFYNNMRSISFSIDREFWTCICNCELVRLHNVFPSRPADYWMFF